MNGKEPTALPKREGKPKADVAIGIPMSPELRDSIDAVAADRVWSRAQAARYLIQRGLDAEAALKEAA